MMDGDIVHVERDRHFDPHRYPRTERANILVNDILTQLQHYEETERLRQRKRKPNDQRNFEKTVAAVVCDLIHRELTKPGGRVAVPLSNQVLGRSGRYGSPALSAVFPDILDTMATPEMGWLQIERGTEGHFGTGKRSTIHAGRRLLTRIDEHEITLADLGRDYAEAEVIELKEGRDDDNDHHDFWGSGSKKLIPYEDTPEANDYRREVQRVNNWLEQADIEAYDDGTSDVVVDAGDRHLRRIFNNGSFKQGGRLFGGFWQHMKKVDRKELITINGERVTELDYGQMTARILYGLSGIVPPGDLYDIPMLQGKREGIKKVFNAMVFRQQRSRRLPAGTRQFFPDHVKCAEIIDRITSRHKPIAHHFFTGVGMEMMFRESEIIVDVLLSLIDHGIIALPIHDAVIIAKSDAEATKQVMLDVFHQHIGVDGVVKEE